MSPSPVSIRCDDASYVPMKYMFPIILKGVILVINVPRLEVFCDLWQKVAGAVLGVCVLKAFPCQGRWHGEAVTEE